MLTTLGEMDESLLERIDTYSEVNGNKLHKIAYHFNGEEVQSSLYGELAQLSLVGEQATLSNSGYPPIEINDDIVTLSVTDAIQILTDIANRSPNSCIDMSTNIFNYNQDTNQKLDFSGKFYVNGKEVRVSLLENSINSLM